MQTLSFQAPDKMSKALAKYAKELKLSKSHLIRESLEQYLEDLEDIAAVKRARKNYNPAENITLAELKRRHGLD